MRSKRLPGLPVLCITSGEQLGRIRHPIVDPHTRRVAAFVVSSGAFKGGKLLPMDAVHALGTDAVTVRRPEALLSFKDEQAAPLVQGERIKLLGASIITVRGQFVGSVQDFEVDDEGQINHLYVTRSFWNSISGTQLVVPKEMLVTMGPDALIVAEEVLALTRPKDSRAADEPEPSDGLTPGRRVERLVREALLGKRSSKVREEKVEKDEPTTPSPPH